MYNVMLSPIRFQARNAAAASASATAPVSSASDVGHKPASRVMEAPVLPAMGNDERTALLALAEAAVKKGHRATFIPVMLPKTLEELWLLYPTERGAKMSHKRLANSDQYSYDPATARLTRNDGNKKVVVTTFAKLIELLKA